MQDTPTTSRAQNRLLSVLSSEDFALFEPHLEAVDLPVRMKLEIRDQVIEHVYFIDSGMASVVANGRQEVEVGIVGREGVTGVSVILGADLPALHQTYMQIAGHGRRLGVVELRKALKCSPSLTATLLLDALIVLGAGDADSLGQCAGLTGTEARAVDVDGQ